MALRYGVMVSTTDFGSAGLSSNLNISTMAQWCNGSHEGLKIPWAAMPVSVRIRSELLNKSLLFV